MQRRGCPGSARASPPVRIPPPHTGPPCRLDRLQLPAPHEALLHPQVPRFWVWHGQGTALHPLRDAFLVWAAARCGCSHIRPPPPPPGVEPTASCYLLTSHCCPCPPLCCTPHQVLPNFTEAAGPHGTTTFQFTRSHCAGGFRGGRACRSGAARMCLPACLHACLPAWRSLRTSVEGAGVGGNG